MQPAQASLATPEPSFRAVRGAWRLTRPGNAAVSAAAAWVGALLGSASLAATAGADAPALGGAAALVPPVATWGAMVASFAFAAAGNVRNDLTDVAIDRIAHPRRPLVSGAVSIPRARLLAFVLYALALIGGALVSPAGLLLVILAVPVMEGYEQWGKQRGLPGNLLIGLLTAAPFVLGAMAGGRVGPAVLSVAALAALATVGREILKDAEDAAADAAHRRTLPIRAGPRVAAWVAGAFLVGAVLLSPLPWVLESILGAAYLAAVGVADACFLGAAFVGFRRPGRAQRLVKLGMVVALVALAVGVAQPGGGDW